MTLAHPPRTGSRRPGLTPSALAVTVLVAQAMAALDTAIVNVAAPSIEGDLQLSASALQFAVYAYILVYAVGLISGARLGARYGYGRLFTYGATIFVLSSLACGLATTSSALVTARAVQGFGAALLVPQVLSILQLTFTGARRRQVLSAYGMVLALGVAAGQVLGGILVTVDLFGTGWRPVFLVNVPIGLAVLAVSTGRLPAGGLRIHQRLDLFGAGLLALVVLALVVPLTFGADAGWPRWCWPLPALGLIGFVIFGRYEARLVRIGREPLIDPGLLSSSSIRIGLLGVFTLMGCFGGLLFTTALYLQHTLNYSPLRSGLTFAAYSAGFAGASLTWTRLPATWHRQVPAAGFATIAAATGALAWTLGRQGWPWPATVLLTVAGAGHGAGFGALVQQIAGTAPAQHASAVSGILGTVNQLSIVAGIAAAGAIYLSAGPPSTSLPAMSWLLLAVAAIQIVVGTAVVIVGSGRAPRTE